MHHLLLPGEGALCYFVLHFQNKASWFSKGMQRDELKRSQVRSLQNQPRNLPPSIKKKMKRKKEFRKKNIKTMKRYPWRLPASRLFGFQSILSVCGATRTLCGRPSIYRSVGRVTLGLNCKQVTSKDHG